jgi:hypothetical protein
MLGAAHGQQGHDVASSKATPNGSRIVAAIPEHTVRPLPRSPACALQPGGIASNNARASFESFLFAPGEPRAASPARGKSDGACSRALLDRWDLDRSDHRRRPLEWKNCRRPPATNQSGRRARANPATQSGSDPTPACCHSASDASTSSPTRTRVPAGASARECRCEGRRQCRSDTSDPTAAVRLWVDGAESARTVRQDPTTHLEAAWRPYRVHATSPTRIRFRGFVTRSKGYRTQKIGDGLYMITDSASGVPARLSRTRFVRKRFRR